MPPAVRLPPYPRRVHASCHYCKTKAAANLDSHAACCGCQPHVRHEGQLLVRVQLALQCHKQGKGTHRANNWSPQSILQHNTDAGFNATSCGRGQRVNIVLRACLYAYKDRVIAVEVVKKASRHDDSGVRVGARTA